VSVKITNTGEMAGTEIAQLYIRDLVAEISRPVKQLKGFKRVFLRPGESALVSFSLTRKDLAFFKKNRSFEAEPGDFSLFIGGSSDRDQLTKFSLKY
jgi:beta-glucosidase